MTTADLLRPFANPSFYLYVVLGWAMGRFLVWVMIRRPGLRVPRRQERALVFAVASAAALDRYVAFLVPGGGLVGLALGWLQRDPAVWFPVGLNLMWIMVVARALRVLRTPESDELFRPQPVRVARWHKILAALCAPPLALGAWSDASTPLLGVVGVTGAAALPAVIFAIAMTPAVVVTERGVSDDFRTIEWSRIRAWWIDASSRGPALSIRFDERGLLGVLLPGYGRGSSGFPFEAGDGPRIRNLFESRAGPEADPS